MAHLKNKSGTGKSTYFRYAETTAAPDLTVQPRRVINGIIYTVGPRHASNVEKNTYQIYSSLDNPDSTDFDEWCKHVSLVKINFKKEFSSSTETLDCKIQDYSRHWKKVVQDFMEAIGDYQQHQRESDNFSLISEESAKCFLLLVPMLANHKPKIYIDASNGCFNADMQTRDNGILTAQISGGGQIFYSYVAQNKKIYKITGTAKFKDSRDFLKFNKILQML